MDRPLRLLLPSHPRLGLHIPATVYVLDMGYNL